MIFLEFSEVLMLNIWLEYAKEIFILRSEIEGDWKRKKAFRYWRF